MPVVKTGIEVLRQKSKVRAHPPPPSAGFNVTFEDLMLNISAGAPLNFARLAAVKFRKLKAPEILSRRVTKGRVTLISILARRRAGRGSSEKARGGLQTAPEA